MRISTKSRPSQLNGINFDGEFLIIWSCKLMTIKHGNLNGCLIGVVRNKQTKKDKTLASQTKLEIPI